MFENLETMIEPRLEATRVIYEASDACKAAKRAFAEARKVCRSTEVAELTAPGLDEMEAHWNQEREALSAADAAAEAAMQAGKAVAKYSDHPGLGAIAMKAAIQAFKTALSWNA